MTWQNWARTKQHASGKPLPNFEKFRNRQKHQVADDARSHVKDQNGTATRELTKRLDCINRKYDVGKPARLLPANLESSSWSDSRRSKTCFWTG